MTLPRIYTQPIDHLENFEASGDDLTVTRHFMQVIEDNEKHYAETGEWPK